MRKSYDIIKMGVCLLMTIALCSCEYDSSHEMGDSGQGGSMARFTIVGDYLYAVNNSNLVTVSIETPNALVEESTIKVGWGGDLETIFPFKGHLLIGSRSAMYIYNINSDPKKPLYTSTASHIISCDPVVAAGDYAYVTLNNGGNCNPSGANELITYDITDLSRPIIQNSIDMNRPQGLTVDGAAEKLFVCDGKLIVFDLANPAKPNKVGSTAGISQAANMDAYDAITLSDKAIVVVTSDDGLYQFDYSGENLSFISHFPITNNN